mmetsp:Transcript_29998/g.87640  ORF Transcript_29998/g.87640 Transcript_29998/m.87640 type:complete len:784 (-) Transcript_29998:238-2589(-)
MYWPVKRSVAKRGQAGGTAASISSTNKLPPPQDVSPGRAFRDTSSDDSPDTSHPALRQTNSWYERATASLVKFWYCDLPPLSGPVRFFYYGFLFFDINWGNNFWASGATYHFRASRCQEKAASLVYYRELGFQMKVDAGVLGHFFAALQDPEEAIPCEAMAFALRLALLCACVGFAGRMPRVVAAAIWVVMVALGHAWWGKPPGHSPNLPAVALISLCFAENNLVDRWSVDSLLARIYRRVTSGTCTGGKQKDSPPWQRGDPSVGGGARKLILVQAVLVMFFAGVHKTATWGIKWLSGSTIGYSIRTQRTRWRWLKKVVLQLPFLPTVMATSSVVGELFSVAALISPRWRPYVVLSWAMFHLGIFLLMNPNFLMQGMTYSLILDWGRILPWIERSSIERGCVLTCNWPSASIERPKPAKASPRMQVGAWVLSAIALLMFLASFLRIDYFPLASYSLYNWDPSEPGFEKMFTADSVKEAAHRCVTEPPLNPTCLNLGGQGMTHENRFHAAMNDHLSFVTIVGDASIAKKGLPSSSRKCPLKLYHGHHGHNFNPYVCWSLDSNTTSQIGGSEHSLEDVLRRLLIDPRHLNKYKDPAKARKPRRLEGEVHSLEAVSSGLGYRTRDAAGSAIAEGGLTCLDDPQDGMSTRMPSPYNSASRYARQIRTHMGSDFIGEDLQILAVGLILGYGKRPSDKMPSRGCMLGSSVVGELDDDTLGNHEIGATSSTRVDLPRPGLSGWMDVIKGGFIVLAVGFVVLLQSKWQTSRKERHSFATPEEQEELLHVDL